MAEAENATSMVRLAVVVAKFEDGVTGRSLEIERDRRRSRERLVVGATPVLDRLLRVDRRLPRLLELLLEERAAHKVRHELVEDRLETREGRRRAVESSRRGTGWSV